MTDERRRRPRLKIFCEIAFSRVDGDSIIRAATENLSSDGFYCTSDEPFSPGDRLDCRISIPIGGLNSQAVILDGRVRVLRVEVKGLEPGFGIACQFEERRVAVQ